MYVLHKWHKGKYGLTLEVDSLKTLELSCVNIECHFLLVYFLFMVAQAYKSLI